MEYNYKELSSPKTCIPVILDQCNEWVLKKNLCYGQNYIEPKFTFKDESQKGAYLNPKRHMLWIAMIIVTPAILNKIILG